MRRGGGGASKLNPAKTLPNLRRGLRRAASRRAVAHVGASLDRHVTSPRGASASIFRERGHLFFFLLVILGAVLGPVRQDPTPLYFAKEGWHPYFLRWMEFSAFDQENGFYKPVPNETRACSLFS